MDREQQRIIRPGRADFLPSRAISEAGSSPCGKGSAREAETAVACEDVHQSFYPAEPVLDLGQAIAEAERCLLCHDAPCSKACPANTNPAEFIRKFRLKNITGAIRTIKSNNILGGACGALCPTSRLCEGECCARMASDENGGPSARPVNIGGLQRFLVDHGRRIGFSPLSPGQLEQKSRVAVVGAGPAGLSCGAELARMGYEVTVFEARPKPGGVLRYGVPSFRLDPELLEREIEDVEKLGVLFKCNSPLDRPGRVEALLGQGYDAVFVGAGLWDAHRLDEGAEAIAGCLSSVQFLAALREERFDDLLPLFRHKNVAVVGGGSVAMDCVESAVRLGARDVYLIYRRSYAQMPAEEEERIKALEAGVHFMMLHQPKGYVAENGCVSGIDLVRTRLGEPDASGRRAPEEMEGSEWRMAVDVIIEAIGNKAPASLSEAYPNVAVSSRGLIETPEGSGRTSVAGIFAGGDIVRGPALVVQAVQDGKEAACAIDRFIQEKKTGQEG